MRFTIGPDHSKICDVLPMDNNGGIRIKDYWENVGELTY
jgi:hypothetical protein